MNFRLRAIAEAQASVYNTGMGLGDLIRQARKTKGLKPVELARAVDVDPATILRIERGESLGRAETIARLIEFLELDPTDVNALLIKLSWALW